MIVIKYLYEKVSQRISQLKKKEEIDFKTLENELIKIRLTKFDVKRIAKELEDEGLIKIKKR